MACNELFYFLTFRFADAAVYHTCRQSVDEITNPKISVYVLLYFHLTILPGTLHASGPEPTWAPKVPRAESPSQAVVSQYGNLLLIYRPVRLGIGGDDRTIEFRNSIPIDESEFPSFLNYRHLSEYSHGSATCSCA